MLNNISVVGNQVIILFVLIAVGFICNKTKLIGKTTVKQLTDFVLYIVTPCVIINSFSRPFEKELLTSLLITFGLSFLSFFINIFLANLLIRDKIESKKKVLKYGAVFSNAGFMAIPLQQAILGDIGVFYGAVFIAVFNILNWTYGIMLMSGDKKYISLKKIFINPGIIGTAIGITLFLLPFNLPSVIGKPIEYFAALNTPLPMVIIGFHLADANLNIKGFSTYFSIIFRLIISPLIILGLLVGLKVEKNIVLTLISATSAPFAASNTMFAEKFGGDTKLSAALVSITTLLSIITMPVIVGFAMNM